MPHNTAPSPIIQEWHAWQIDASTARGVIFGLNFGDSEGRAALTNTLITLPRNLAPRQTKHNSWLEERLLLRTNIIPLQLIIQEDAITIDQFNIAQLYGQ